MFSPPSPIIPPPRFRRRIRQWLRRFRLRAMSTLYPCWCDPVPVSCPPQQAKCVWTIRASGKEKLSKFPARIRFVYLCLLACIYTCRKYNIVRVLEAEMGHLALLEDILPLGLHPRPKRAMSSVATTKSSWLLGWTRVYNTTDRAYAA